MMKKLGLYAFSLTVFIVGCLYAFSPKAHASLVGFDAGRMMDDSVMANTGTMNTNQIQNFLNSKVPACDTNGTQSAADWGYPNLTHAQFATQVMGWPGPPYTCLRDYIASDGRSAAQVINDAAQAYTINPQVLITLLQKEQGLVTDTWPMPWQYKTATGYACPDTAPCDTQYFGLINQLTWGAKLFHSVITQNPNWYSPYTIGDNFIQWNPSSTCGGSTVNIKNWATAALYDYTPYQPDQASLASGYGSGDSCSSYGNRNFYNYFTDWFGSTQNGSPYQWNLVGMTLYADVNRTVALGKDPNGAYALTPGQTAYGTVQARNIGSYAWTSDTKLATTNTPVFGNNNWPAYNRIATLTATPVGYGDVGTYNFSFTAPATAGSYTQTINLNQADAAWFNDIGLSIPANVVTPLTTPLTTNYQLPTNGILTTGQRLTSPYNKSVLSLENGQLCLYNNTKTVWCSGTAGSGATKLVNQADGNLVLYTDAWKPVWATGTDGKGAANLVVQTDGNVVLYAGSGAVWASNTWMPSESSTVNYTMTGYGILFQNQSLTTADRKYTLILQADGNLVLYSPTRALWATGTDGKGGDRLVMQNDGNLVLYTKNWIPLWASNRDGFGASLLILQTDHNLVTYKQNAWIPSWASNTNGL